MSLDVTVTVDLDDLRNVRESLRGDSRRLREGMARAVNDTAKHVKSFISRELRKHLPMKKKVLDRNISVERAQAGRTMVATVTIRDRGPLPLKLFSPRQRKGGELTVKIDKAGPRGPVPSQYRAGLQTPFRGTERTAGQVLARRGAARLPIAKLFGPSPLDVYEEHGLPAAVAEDTEVFLHKRLQYRLG